MESIRRFFSDADLVVTSAQGDARRLAGDAAGHFDTVLAVGGDGTVHEVAAGLLDNPSRTALAVLPTGTGNDFARMIGMPNAVCEAVEALVTADCVAVDAGYVAWTDRPSVRQSTTEKTGRADESTTGGPDGPVPDNGAEDTVRDRHQHTNWFVNAVGIGFDGFAASLAPKYKHYPFKSGYLVAVLHALLSWKPVPTVITDFAKERKLMYEGDFFMLTVGNGRDSGGGFTINPKASLTDHLLDACLVTNIGIFRALRLLPRAMNGTHLELQEVLYWQSPRLRLCTTQPVPIHADGEVLTVSATEVIVEIRPSALSLLVPRNTSFANHSLRT